MADITKTILETDVTTQNVTTQNVTTQSELDDFLAQMRKETSVQARLIFALDATQSRQPTWDMACELQAQMFAEVTSIGSLQVQLVFFRGQECRASNWMTNPAQLAKAMRSLGCVGGITQIGKVLSHVLRENTKAPVAAVVFVGDAFEELEAPVLGKARELNVPMFVFQEGKDPDVESCFRGIAKATGGAYARFDQGAARQLGDLLRAVAAFATGGIKALESRNDAASIRLLGQMKGV
jgi:hypothetical protein